MDKAVRLEWQCPLRFSEDFDPACLKFPAQNDTEFRLIGSGCFDGSNVSQVQATWNVALAASQHAVDVLLTDKGFPANSGCMLYGTNSSVVDQGNLRRHLWKRFTLRQQGYNAHADLRDGQGLIRHASITSPMQRKIMARLSAVAH